MRATDLRERLECFPIIAAIRDDRWQKALRSPAEVLFYLEANLLTVKQHIQQAHDAGKVIFVHLDLAEGIGKDRAGVRFLAQCGADGVLSTRAQLIRYAKGVSLQPVVESETYDVEGYAIDDMNQYGGFTDVPFVQAAAVLNEDAGELTVFVINGDEHDVHELTLDASAFAGWHYVEHVSMSTDDPEAFNDHDHPDVIVPAAVPGTCCEGGVAKAVLKPLSWNMIRFEKNK